MSNEQKINLCIDYVTRLSEQGCCHFTKANHNDIAPIKQLELYEKFRPLIPKQYQDETCPYPGDEIFYGEKRKKSLKAKLKRELKDEKKEKNKNKNKLR